MGEEQNLSEWLVLADFNILKVCLYKFIKNKFNPCEDFIKGLAICVNENDLVKLFNKYNYDIFERLGGDSLLQYEINDLKYEIDKLERNVSDLEYDIGELNFKVNSLTLGDTLYDEYKTEFFHKYQNNYTPWEIEELLKNGKKYLTE